MGFLDQTQGPTFSPEFLTEVEARIERTPLSEVDKSLILSRIKVALDKAPSAAGGK